MMQHERVNESIPQGMRPGRRELNEARANITFSDAVPAHMREQIREVSGLYVPPAARGRRLATALMNFICQEADSNRITLLLIVDSFQTDDDEPLGPDDDQLAAWYAKFGFTKLQDSPKGQIMVRRVHAPTPKLVAEIDAINRLLVN